MEQSATLVIIQSLVGVVTDDALALLIDSCQIPQSGSTQQQPRYHWLKVNWPGINNVKVFYPFTLFDSSESRIFRNNIKDGIDRYIRRLNTVNVSFEALIGTTDLIVVDDLEKYIPGTPKEWYALHSSREGSRSLPQFPDWVREDLVSRTGNPVIFLEKNHLLVNNAQEGTALAMHELAHILTDGQGEGYGRWDFWDVSYLYGNEHDLGPGAYHSQLSVRAKTTDKWFEWSADYIADWAYDTNVDNWQDALMRCFLSGVGTATCETNFRASLRK